MLTVCACPVFRCVVTLLNAAVAETIIPSFHVDVTAWRSAHPPLPALRVGFNAKQGRFETQRKGAPRNALGANREMVTFALLPRALPRRRSW